MDLAERIKEERLRLGLSQTEFAAVAGASKHSQINWEKGVSSPNAAALAAWGVIGADVTFIITGRRVVPLTPEELALLDNYRHCDPGEQKAIRATSAALAEQKGDYKPRKRSAG